MDVAAPGGSPSTAMRRRLVLECMRSSPTFLSRHLIDSYDEFLARSVPEVVAEHNDTFVMKKDRDPARGISKSSVFRVNVDNVRYRSPVVSLAGAAPEPLFPNVARVMQENYSIEAVATVRIDAHDLDADKHFITEFPEVRIARIPLMLRSRQCALHGMGREQLAASGEDPDDPGGYFVQGGREMAVIAQEAQAVNQPVVRAVGAPAGGIFSSGGPDDQPGGQFELVFPSAPRDSMYSPYYLRLIAERRGGGFAVSFAHRPFSRPLPLAALFRALGVESDRDIVRHVLGKEVPGRVSPAALVGRDGRDGLDALDMAVLLALRPTLEAGAEEAGFTRDTALAALSRATAFGENEIRRQAPRDVRDVRDAPVVSKDGLAQAEVVLRRELLRGCGESMAAKAVQLGALARQLLLVAVGMAPPGDERCFVGKRLVLAGPLLASVFREAYRAFQRAALVMMDRAFYFGPAKTTGNLAALVTADKAEAVFDHRAISSVLAASFRGDWGMHRDSKYASDAAERETSIVKGIERRSWIGFLADLRGARNPIDPESRGGEVALVRHVHGSQYGVYCPIESPEGEKIGLHNHLTLLAHVTNHSPTRVPIAAIEASGLASADFGAADLRGPPARYRVLVNGVLEFVTDRAVELVARLRAQRRAQQLDLMTSVVLRPAERTVEVNTDGGRVCRPLLVCRAMGALGALGALDAPAQGDDAPAGASEDSEDERNRAAVARWRARLLPPTPAAAGGGAAASGQGAAQPPGQGAAQPPVEYLDVDECWSRALIAANPEDADARTTHVEIHPVAALSATSAGAVLIHHNNSPYNIFAGQFGKHASSLYHTAFRTRFDSEARVLNTPQLPLVRSFLEEAMALDTHPRGENVIVAFMCQAGFNIEDAVIINRASLERGLLSITFYDFERFVDEAGETESVVTGLSRTQDAGASTPGKPGQPGQPGQPEGPGLLPSGLPRVDSPVVAGQPLIGRVRVRKSAGTAGAGGRAGAGEAAGAGLGAAARMLAALAGDALGSDDAGGPEAPAMAVGEDVSPDAHEHMTGRVVDAVLDARTIARTMMGDAAERCVSIRYRQLRQLSPGDKVASRHGQKGVVGAIVNPEDMPFTADGIIPDIVFNPHAIPSRRTMGHFMEHLMAKAACLEARMWNGTPLEDSAPESAAAARALAAAGLHPAGEELFVSGSDGGEAGSISAFAGPCYYQRLRQMTVDKLQYRGREGPRDSSTQQPVKGRSRGGGLRLGEQERDALLAHGVAQTLQESFMERSDAMDVWVDEQGDPAVADLADDAFRSSAEGDPQAFARCRVPRSFVVLRHELETMGARVRLETDITPPP